MNRNANIEHLNFANMETSSSGGIRSINGSTASDQTINISQTGTAFTLNTDIGTGATIINLPDMNTGKTQGILNSTTQTITGNKTFTGDITATNILSLDNLYGDNGCQIEFLGVGAPPACRVISNYDWALGASHQSDLNKQISMGYSVTLGSGLIYAFDQLAGIGKDIRIGFPGYAGDCLFSNVIKASAGRLGVNRLQPIAKFPDNSSYNMTYCASVNTASGTFYYTSGSLSCNKLSTGIFDIGHNSLVYPICTANIIELSTYGFITCERPFLNITRIAVRNAAGSLVDYDFDIIMCAQEN